MATKGILPVKISLPQGDYYTLWAPLYKDHGAEWQAFLGHDEHVYFFNTPGQLLAFLETNAPHDLTDHPKWGAYNDPANPLRVLPDDNKTYDICGVPTQLAQRPGYTAVSAVDRAFSITRSLGDVLTNMPIQSFFASHSLLANVSRGHDHYAGEDGLSEWSAVGRAVLSNWPTIASELDAMVFTPAVDPAAESDASSRIAASLAAKEEEAEEAAEKVDPYDVSVWGQAGIDPVKIVIDGKTLYTLRTYLNEQPVFLGKYGEITSFTNRKAMVRWLIEHKDHNFASLSTWEDVMVAANGGDLEVTVHADNTYVFTGLAAAINEGPAKVDAEQLVQAYSLLADAADWAQDDAVSSVLVANPKLQEFIAYVSGSPSGYVPSAPYTTEVDGWKQLESGLIARFSKF